MSMIYALLMLLKKLFRKPDKNLKHTKVVYDQQILTKLKSIMRENIDFSTGFLIVCILIIILSILFFPKYIFGILFFILPLNFMNWFITGVRYLKVKMDIESGICIQWIDYVVQKYQADSETPYDSVVLTKTTYRLINKELFDKILIEKTYEFTRTKYSKIIIDISTVSPENEIDKSKLSWVYGVPDKF